jgi:serine/threonine protein kinase
MYQTFLEELKTRIPREKHFISYDWLMVHGSTDLPPSGWKIHVSLSFEDFNDRMLLTLCELVSLGVHFKIPASERALQKLLSPVDAGPQIGKILTLYSQSRSAFETLLDFVQSQIPHSHGPRVRTWRGGEFKHIGYRHGTFALVVEEDSLGRPYRVFQEGVRDEPDVSSEATSLEKVSSAIKILNLNKTFKPLFQFGMSAKIVISALKREDASSWILKFGYKGENKTRGHQCDFTRIQQEWRVLTELGVLSKSTGMPLLFEKKEEVICLAIPFVAGQYRKRLPPDLFLKASLNLAKALDQLHHFGWSHGDVKPSNALVTEVGEVSLIDFEDAFPLSCGKHDKERSSRGYFSNREVRQFDPLEPDFLGYLMTLLVWWTGVDPSETRLDYENHFDSLLRTIEVDPLRKYLQRSFQRASNGQTPKKLTQDLYNAIEEIESRGNRISILESLENFQVEDGTDWRNDHLFPWAKMRGINLGTAGILLYYLAYVVREECHSLEGNQAFFCGKIQNAAFVLKERPFSNTSHGLMSGNMGVMLALAKASEADKTLKSELNTLIVNGRGSWKKTLKAYEAVKSGDFFSGKAGILLGLLTLELSVWAAESRESASVFTKASDHVGHALLTSLKQHEGILGAFGDENSEMANDLFLGAAHGSAGIALALSKWGKRRGFNEVVELSKEMFRQLFRLTALRGWLPKSLSTANAKTDCLTWCHGELGLHWCAALAYPTEDSFVELRTDFLKKLQLQFRPKNASLCHGSAGVLDLLNICSILPGWNSDYDHFRWEVAEHLWRSKRTTPKGCHWESDKIGHTTPDFWVGFTGTAAALHNFYTKRGESVLETIGVLP